MKVLKVLKVLIIVSPRESSIYYSFFFDFFFESGDIMRIARAFEIVG